MNKKTIISIALSGLLFASVSANAADISLNNNIQKISFEQAKDMGLMKVKSVAIRDNKTFSSLMEKMDMYLIKNNAEYYSTTVFAFGTKDHYLANVTIYSK